MRQADRGKDKDKERAETGRPREEQTGRGLRRADREREKDRGREREGEVPSVSTHPASMSLNWSPFPPSLSNTVNAFPFSRHPLSPPLPAPPFFLFFILMLYDITLSRLLFPLLAHYCCSISSCAITEQPVLIRRTKVTAS